jgi:hypothetical protein
VAGHAGLFVGTDIHQLLACLVLSPRQDNFCHKLDQEFFSRDETVKNSTYVRLGYAVRSKSASGNAFLLRRSSWFTELRFGGIWKKLRCSAQTVSTPVRMKKIEFRPMIHDLILKTLNPNTLPQPVVIHDRYLWGNLGFSCRPVPVRVSRHRPDQSVYPPMSTYRKGLGFDSLRLHAGICPTTRPGRHWQCGIMEQSKPTLC